MTRHRSLPILSPVSAFDGLWLKAFLALGERLRVGEITVFLPDGRMRVFGGERGRSPSACLIVHSPRAARRLFLDGSAGFGEAYMDGDWSSPDLARFLDWALANEQALRETMLGGRLLRAGAWIKHRLRPNTRRGSRRNITYHYDLGNDFYRSWLDPSLTYSAALFDPTISDLSAAQERKYRKLATMLDLRPGLRLLEIGCGWGGFAIMAARDYGCHVLGITLSRAQQEEAEARVHRAGLGEQVKIALEDYRDVTGSFDRIASVEMFEAVGEANWPTYFGVVRDRLLPGGVAGLQIISIADDRFEEYRRGADFIQRHIFPGGMLPSPARLAEGLARAGLQMTDTFSFAASYARTLEAWRHRFLASWPEIRSLGFDGRFKRMWEFYLAYCEAGFRAGTIEVAQYRVVHG